MRKIKLSNETKTKHINYFKKNILNNLYRSQLDGYKYTSKEIKLCKVDSTIFDNKFNKQHYFFVRFVKNRYKVFAAGNMGDLSSLYQEIREQFPLIMKMIEIKDSSLDKSYRDYLYKIFGYEDFKVKSLYYYIKQIALEKLGRYKYSSSVFLEIQKILEENFPDKILEISKVLNYKNRPLTNLECEKAFKNLKNCNITMDNFKRKKIFGEDWNDYTFIMESGIRVCPYCNRQYITPIYSDRGKMRADIDHFLPKSKYPFFSMSLYNLVPVCKSCNQSLKRDIEFTFKSINPYEDSLDEYFTFYGDTQTNEITIVYNNKIYQEHINMHIDTFKIEALYNYHQNQVEEMVKKRVAYPDEYIKKLYEQNRLYFRDELEVKQVIIGFIDDKRRMNDEAFLKLRRDIAVQLGFMNNHKLSKEEIERLRRIIK